MKNDKYPHDTTDNWFLPFSFFFFFKEAVLIRVD